MTAAPFPLKPASRRLTGFSSVCSVAFHGDFILSRSAQENKVVLWLIQNFNSKEPTPPYEEAPTTHEYRDTRSAFGGTFERIMQFSTPDAHPFFLRFGFFTHPHMHPVLAMGNIHGKIFLWDLTTIEEYGRGGGWDDDHHHQHHHTTNCNREGSTSSCSTTTTTTAGMSALTVGGPGSGSRSAHPKRDDISDVFAVIKPHLTLDIPKFKGTIRHIAFSLAGNYMVAVGDQGHISISKRW